jgi:MerR family transcriptional regulator, light-induced transcriptional regulator
MNLQEAAEKLGVHYQTAYRWVREGQITAAKVGSSYVVTDAEVNRFMALRLVPTQPPQRLTIRDWSTHRAKLGRALLAGEELDARSVIDRLTDGHVSGIELCEELVAPCMAEIGDQWHRGEVSIAEEHRATAICERILARIASHPRGRPRGTAVVLAAPGDSHGLPALMAALALRDDRWRVHHLGVNVPLADVIQLAQSSGATLIVLSVTFAASVEAQDAANKFRAEGFGVLIGGRGRSLRDLLVEAREYSLAAVRHRDSQVDTLLLGDRRSGGEGSPKP